MQQRKGTKPRRGKKERKKKKGELAWPLILFLQASCGYLRQLLEIQIFKPACKVTLPSDESNKEQEIYAG